MNQRALTKKDDDLDNNENQNELAKSINDRVLVPDIHVKFRRDAVEVKRKAKVHLESGRHRLVFDGIAHHNQKFRLVINDGAAGVVHTRLRFPNDLDQKQDLDLAKKTHEEDLTEISRALVKAEQKIDQAMQLLKEWLAQARTQVDLNIGEWREGIELLEHTLLERTSYHQSLSDTMTKIKLKVDHSPFSDEQHSRCVYAEVEVDREDHYLVELSYILERATWLPIYQARLSETQFEQTGTKPKIEAKVNLEMSARFAQATQETWANCSTEFCLYPSPSPGFPILNYPSYEKVKVDSCHLLTSQLDLDLCLESPWASLCHLFSDQATLSLNLELDLSLEQPDVVVIGSGKLDTLLPIGGGLIHRFVGDEWIGHNQLSPLVLGDILSLDFGLYAPIESCVKMTPIDHPMSLGIVGEEDAPETSQLKIEPTDRFEQIEVALKNTDQQVRTVLVSHPLSAGQLVSTDEDRPENSAPVGWVLSADRTRLMRWVSIAPNRTEKLTLRKKCP